MASLIEFVLTGDQENAKRLAVEAAATQGFAATEKGASIEFERGSNGLSVAFGVLAGKRFYLKFVLAFSVAPDGRLLARLSRDTAGTASRHGAPGVMKASHAFQEVADAIGAATAKAGVFAANRILA